MTRSSAITAGGVAALGVGTVLALTFAWGRVAAGWASFGSDLIAYEQAAARLETTGSPYSAELAAGPIENDARNVAIGYFYPPPLAQAFVPLRGIDHDVLAIVWTVAQAILAFVLLPLVWRRSGGAAGLGPLLWVIAFALGSFPFQFALIVGNVSGWSALLIGALLVTQGRSQGLLAGGLGLLKSVNLPTFLVALVERRSRFSALGLVVGVAAMSFVLSPNAWFAWIQVLPNILALPAGGSPANVSPVALVTDPQVRVVVSVSSAMAAVACFGVAIWLVRREGISRRAVTAASACSLLINPTIWDHYLSVLVPITIAAWPNISDRWRLLLVVGGFCQVIGWFGWSDVAAPALFGGWIAITLASLLGEREPGGTLADPPQGSSSG